MPSESETLEQIARLFLITQTVEHYVSTLIAMAFPEKRPNFEELAKLNKNTLGSLIKKLKESEFYEIFTPLSLKKLKKAWIA